ncbi:hypothetical protein ALP83_200135 [Pseudomonas syringae pv. actinidiae]|uniref:Uncharacterized protein n=1 Tax=Pseudomonas syringae pv. actinidiae TaxID=103796 RepID=A0A7Z6UGF9_PSESF|nr:hypothetical protein [Pseudomonas syringae]RMR55636.1 hypothetical protein ALP83_200135 [Pseudomonas syringae pv. actinidiae]
MKENFDFNPKSCSINDLNPGCVEMWTLGQQVAIRRLCVKTRAEYKQPARYELLKDFSTRAARIAGNYARIYLEQEYNGQPEQKGRFYWTGLAAFASKQVMCALDYSSNTKMRYLPPAVPPLEITKIFLGKGNFWLFQDIFVWHWFYINYPQQFNECIKTRDFSTYDPRFKQSFAQLPWIDDALPKINNLKVTDYLVSGFKLISAVEKEPAGTLREKYKFQSLLAIAKHEQLMILQPLIYEDKSFRALLYMQTWVEGYGDVPRRLASLSVECDTGDPEQDVIMSDGELYDAEDRMIFITTIASTYHRRMQRKNVEMEKAIMTIGTWNERTT